MFDSRDASVFLCFLQRTKEWKNMKKVISAVLAVVWVVFFSPFHLTNAYLRSSVFDTVTVERQETVWQIAGRYTEDEGHIRSLVEAIIEVNALSPDGAIRAGQRLRVPALKADAGPQFAHR